MNRPLKCHGCRVVYFTDDMVDDRFCMYCYSRWISNLRGDPRYYPPVSVCSRCNSRQYVKDGNFRDVCATCSTITKKWNLSLRVCFHCKNRFRGKARRGRVYCNDIACSLHRRRGARMVLARLKDRHTPAEWEALREVHDGTCVYCQAAPGSTKDHIIPVSRGGSDGIDNIAPACGPCNSSKGNRLLPEWLSQKNPKLSLPEISLVA